MKRRSFIRNLSSGLLTSSGTLLALALHATQAQSASGGITLQWLGHSCFLFTGDGQRILVNPFKPGGCTAKYPKVQAASDLVLISSQLLDEGFVETLPGDPKLLFEAGIYRVGNLQIQGIASPHDRRGGKQFGQNMAWKWTQGGVKILHLGGIASPISLEQQILMGQPDVLFVPVGGGPKIYTPEEAAQAVQTLKPKIVIPTQYQTSAADPKTCNLSSVSAFVQLMGGTSTQKIQGGTLSVSKGNLPAGSVIYILSNPA